MLYLWALVFLWVWESFAFHMFALRKLFWCYLPVCLSHHSIICSINQAQFHHFYISLDAYIRHIYCLIFCLQGLTHEFHIKFITGLKLDFCLVSNETKLFKEIPLSFAEKYFCSTYSIAVYCSLYKIYLAVEWA